MALVPSLDKRGGSASSAHIQTKPAFGGEMDPAVEQEGVMKECPRGEGINEG